ncbi:MAG: PAS domain-containing protein [Lutimaribacter sp.]
MTEIGNGLGRLGAGPVLPQNLRHAAPLLAQFDGYWQALAAQYGAPPFRHHVDPRALQNGLENAFLAEEIAPGHARLRVAGQMFRQLLGSDPRGMPLSALFLPGARANLQALLGQVFATPAGARVLVAGPARLLGSANSGILQLWPLRDDTGGVTRVLGCMVLARAPAHRSAPQRLNIVHHSLHPLISAAHPDPAPNTETPRKGAAHLVLVKGRGAV